MWSNIARLTNQRVQITFNNVFKREGKLFMCKKNMCVASKNSELEGVAALKRLRTTVVEDNNNHQIWNRIFDRCL
jgi:hypothetical protein